MTPLGDNLYAPVRPASVRFATPSQAQCWLRRTPTNGLTACRMPLQMFSAGSGKHSLRHCENPSGPYVYRRLPAFASLSMAGSVRSDANVLFSYIGLLCLDNSDFGTINGSKMVPIMQHRSGIM